MDDIFSDLEGEGFLFWSVNIGVVRLGFRRNFIVRRIGLQFIKLGIVFVIWRGVILKRKIVRFLFKIKIRFLFKIKVWDLVWRLAKIEVCNLTLESWKVIKLGVKLEIHLFDFFLYFLNIWFFYYYFFLHIIYFFC